MRPVLVEGLGRDPAEVFATFDETPVASASLAQVYFATLQDGTAVAVKVQKPELRRKIETDFDLALWLAQKAQARVPALAAADLTGVIEESRAAVLRELDFRNEARNQAYFARLNPHPDRVTAPRVWEELTAEGVLTMERVTGKSVTEAAELPLEQRARVAGWGAESLIRQVFVAGFFHGDPHAGNIHLTADGRLCFLDWGLVGHLTRRLRYALADFWVAAVEQDTERIVQIVAELAPVDARPDLRALEKEVTLVLREDGRIVNRKRVRRLMRLMGIEALVSCTRFFWTPICPRRDWNDDVQHEADRRSFLR